MPARQQKKFKYSNFNLSILSLSNIRVYGIKITYANDTVQNKEISTKSTVPMYLFKHI